MTEEYCHSCGQDLRRKIQVYPRPGVVLCQECNWRMNSDIIKEN